ncbi:glycosyltransferase family 39 protein [Nakamurella sp. A5-74]|uniref:Glycosyltransferase family 39 protein n=1 Tax=Nakamurella sp. A5-74 TaxID=3158264 RepID=A0AAU8DR16_9ACTN
MTSAAPADTDPHHPAATRPPFARLPAWSAVLTVAVLLTVLSSRYGFHRDELYFRMLTPAWNYLDQPPLTPWLVRTMTSLVADEAWAVRIPATLFLAGSVLVIAAITREVGGSAAAQMISAWGYAFGALPLTMGHVMLTASVDLLVWPLVALFVIRALRREDARWWIPAGVLIGLSTYNKLLIAYLVIALLMGLAAWGPRRVFRSPWPWSAAGLAVLIALPNLIYQATHDWPQLAMGAALSGNNGSDVRVQAVPFLALLIGPPMVPIWVAGLVALARRPDWRPLRSLVVALLVVVALTVIGGAQVYYPLGLLAVVFAIGAVPTADWIHRGRGRVRRVLVTTAVALDVVVCSVISLPVLPLSVVGSTPVLDINQTVGDQIGWPTYVAQIRSVIDSLSPADRAGAVIIATNYGEAGALDRFGPASALPPILSGHNALADQSAVPASVTVAVVVGEQVRTAGTVFESCRTVAVLDNGVDADNEEQDQPIALCRNPIGGFPAAWREFRHLD